MSGDARSGALARFLLGEDDPGWGTRPADYDPAFVKARLPGIERWFGEGWFGLRFEGWHHLPPPPVLFIGNHSGGLLTPDVYGLMAGWYREQGVQRPLHSMSHELVFVLPSLGRHFTRMGALRAHPTHGKKVLVEHRRDLLVMPGGDVDVWRPHRERYQVKFAGRKGYARLAIEAGVPIVPLAHAGAHSTLMVLSDGHNIAQALGFHRRFRADVFPIHLSLPLGLNVGPWPHLPLPVTLRYRFGAPIYSETSTPTEVAVNELDARVRASMQAELDVLASEERPLVGRIRRGLSRIKSSRAPR